MRFLIGLGLLGCGSDKSITTVNKAPEATITSHSNGAEVFEGFLITLRGSASDSNSSYDELTATWYAGTEVVCEAIIPENDGTTECEITIGVADTTFVLEVKDAQNATGATSVELVVIPTESPDVFIVQPLSEGVYYSDQLITFEGILLDAEDNSEELVGYWESNVDGLLENVDAEPNTDGETEGFGLLTEGQHAIQLHVEDSTGKTGSESVIVNVGPPNSSPLCEIISPIDGSVSSQGETINFAGVATDMDVASDLLSVIWNSDKDGEIGTLNPN